MRNLRIVYMGTPEFAVAPLEKLLECNYNVVGVVTTADKPSGRGLKINESAVKQYVKGNENLKNIPILQPSSLKDEEFLQQLRDLEADLFIVVAFRMLPKVVWAMPKFGTFNLHASLLPKYRGAAPINWAIINGDKRSGVTTFLLDEQIDTGNILLQEEVEILEHENVGSLYNRLMAVGAELVIKTVEGLCSSSIDARAQEGEATNAPKLNAENTTINWNRGAVEIMQLILGLSPYPAAKTLLKSSDKEIAVKIYDAEVEDRVVDKDVGEVLTDSKSYLKVVCGDNKLLSIKEIQLAGKKRMYVKDLLLGFRDILNYKFS